MYRAIKYLKNNKKNSILVGFIFTILLSILLSSNMIKTTVQELIGGLDYTNAFEVKIVPQMSFEMGESKGRGRINSGIKKEVVDYLKNNNIVTNVKYNINMPINSNLTPITISDNYIKFNNLILSGTSDLLLESNIKNGVIKTDVNSLAGNQILISNLLLEQNNLSIGQDITLINSKDGLENEFKIVGVFSNNEEIDLESNKILDNTIYGSIDVVSDFSGDNNKYNSVSFFVKNVTDISIIENDLFSNNILDKEKFKLIQNDNVFKTIISPLHQIENVLNNISIGTIILSIFLFIILNLIFLKQRYNEIGILLSIGETKFSIIKQLLLETILIFLFSFVISFIIGFLINSFFINYINELLLTKDIINILNQIGSTMTSFNGSIDIITILLIVISVLVVLLIVYLVSLLKLFLKQPKDIMNLE